MAHLDARSTGDQEVAVHSRRFESALSVFLYIFCKAQIVRAISKERLKEREKDKTKRKKDRKKERKLARLVSCLCDGSLPRKKERKKKES